MRGGATLGALAFAVAVTGLGLAGPGRADPAGSLDGPPPRVWVFTATEGPRHASIADGVALARSLAAEHGFAVETIEAGARFRASALDGVATVVWMNASGEVLDDAGREAFRRYLEAGGGFVGVHAAAAAEREWPFFGEILGGGARFREHPPIQAATLDVRSPAHPSVRHLRRRFSLTEEWYVFTRHPGPAVQTLLVLDPRGVPGPLLQPDHPIAWFHQVGAGRAWYTALGHRPETYADPRFAAHLLGGIRWTGRFDDAPLRGAAGPWLLVGGGALAVMAAWAWRREPAESGVAQAREEPL